MTATARFASLILAALAYAPFAFAMLQQSAQMV